MCRICDPEFVDLKEKAVSFGKLKAGMNLSLYVEDGKFVAELDNKDGELIESISYKIKYCPNCGKKVG